MLYTHYEKIVEDPFNELTRIMSFLALLLHELQLMPQIVGIDPRSNVEAHSRLSQPIDGMSIGCWSREMTKNEIRKFQRIAGNVLGHCGYD